MLQASSTGVPPMTRGIVSIAGYVPYRRLRRADVAGVFGSGGGKGARSVASHDEDTTTMGVEAARLGPARRRPGAAPAALWFATATPAYLDKTNATTVHAALRQPADVAAFDFGGALRSAVGALRTALGAAGRHHPGRRVRPARRAGRLGRRARRGRRRRGRPRRRRRTGHAGHRRVPGSRRVGQRRIPRPLAHAGRAATPRSGRSGSARSATCRWPRGLAGGAEGRRRGRRRGRPLVVAGLHGRAVQGRRPSRSACATASWPTTCRPRSGNRARPTPGWSWPTLLERAARAR